MAMECLVDSPIVYLRHWSPPVTRFSSRLFYMKKNGDAPLSSVMELLLDAICVVDKRGCFVSISGGCERIFGYVPEEMIGKPMIDFVFHEDRVRTLQAVDRIEAGICSAILKTAMCARTGRSSISCGRRVGRSQGRYESPWHVTSLIASVPTPCKRAICHPRCRAALAPFGFAAAADSRPALPRLPCPPRTTRYCWLWRLEARSSAARRSFAR